MPIESQAILTFNKVFLFRFTFTLQKNPLHFLTNLNLNELTHVGVVFCIVVVSALLVWRLSVAIRVISLGSELVVLVSINTKKRFSATK